VITHIHIDIIRDAVVVLIASSIQPWLISDYLLRLSISAIDSNLQVAAHGYCTAQTVD